MKKPKTVKITKRVVDEWNVDSMGALRRICIMRDEDPMNPRTEWDNVFTIYSECRYLASDKDAENPVVCYGSSPDKADFRDGVCAFPFYAYVHGGMVLSMSPFGDPWDSGCAGFIYVDKEKFCKEYGLKRFSRKRAYKIAKGEIETLNQYVTGEVYGFVEQTRASVDDEWVDGDSCWGYFGDESIPDMLADARAYEEGTIICEGKGTTLAKAEYTMEIAA